MNSRPLTYVSSEEVEEPLTPSHLLVGYRILTLPDPSLPADPDYCEHAGGVTRRMNHLTKTLQKFWKRWKKEYLLELREFHRTHRVQGGVACDVRKGEVVTVYDEGHPRGLWRLGRVEDVMQGADGEVRGAYVKVSSKKGHTKVLRRPIQHLYPLEICPEPADGELINTTSPHDLSEHQHVKESASSSSDDAQGRPIRASATQARDRILGCMID